MSTSGLEQYAKLFYRLHELVTSGHKAEALKLLHVQSTIALREMADALAFGLNMDLVAPEDRSGISIIEQELRDAARVKARRNLAVLVRNLG